MSDPPSSESTSVESEASPSLLRRAWPFVKWTLFALLMAFVLRRAWDIWQRDRASLAATDWHPGWLLLAGAAYAAGWLPSVWFWRKMMKRLGERPRYRDVARAYYCGHLGKYVPGKAAVVVIRAALMKERGVRSAAAALTCVYETLVLMGAGVAVAAALAPRLLTDERVARFPYWLHAIVTRPYLPSLVVVILCAAALPILSQLFTRVATKMAPRELVAGQGTMRIEPSLLGQALVAFAGGWACLGVSLGCTLRAVGGESFLWSDWPVWTGAAALATSIGFLAIFAPGGLGVREGLLFETLAFQPGIGPAHALAAAVFLRVVWFVTELVMAGVILEHWPRRGNPKRIRMNWLAEFLPLMNTDRRR